MVVSEAMIVSESKKMSHVETVVVTEICVTSGHTTRFIASEHISGVWSIIDSLSDTRYMGINYNYN